MADVAVEAAPEATTPVQATPVKKGRGPAKKTKPKSPAHPKTSEMVTSAIEDLKDKSGSSLQAIKKYIAANYKVDADRLAPFIKKYLKGAVESGALVRTKGKGAAGSFKLEAKVRTDTKRTKALSEKKHAAEKKGVKAGGIKKKTIKKVAPTPVKKPTPVKTPAKAKTPTKAKKTTKPPTKKPKAPKAKKVGAKPGRKAAKK